MTIEDFVNELWDTENCPLENFIGTYNKIHVTSFKEGKHIYLFPMPGITKEDVDITLFDKHFEIKVNKTNKFVIDTIRKVIYPVNMNVNKGYSANMKDGLLTIEFESKIYPKVEIN